MSLPASRSPSPGDGAAAPGSGANFTALLAARKFRANAMSEEKREERRTAGAKLRAELPPGPLPDTTPPTTSKLLARLMSRDGMTPGDRARKQARLREMRDALAAKENVSPENRGEAPSSRDSRVERLESPTIYMSQQEVTDEKHGGDASPSDMDLSATETAPVPAVPVVVPADAMSEADFTTPDAGPRSAPRSPQGANEMVEREAGSAHPEPAEAVSAERRARDQERAEAGRAPCRGEGGGARRQGAGARRGGGGGGGARARGGGRGGGGGCARRARRDGSRRGARGRAAGRAG